MENTKFIYAVNSDLDDDLLYAEFETEEAAIEYATKHLDKLPFIDKVELVVDDGGYEDAVTYTTIWDHTMVDTKSDVEEDDYWDMIATNYEEGEKDKYDLGDTTWFEPVDTNDLVEAMEENEDLVECKECFDLFPKADCVKLEIGYICPHCNCGHEVTEEDTFKVDFPEYEKFNYENDMVSEEPISKVEPSEEVPASEPVGPEGEPGLTPEEAVPFLVNDEVEAVAGYEQAAEVVADSDLENKEEILDTIDHIKEEEEEHIEELQDLVDDEIVEVENDPISTEEVEPVNEAKCTDCGGELKDNKCTSCDRDFNLAKCKYCGGVVKDGKCMHCDTKAESLNEHVNKECSPIESDQELEGTDNAVVDCKVADVVTHSEDEKPVDCEGKKKPLSKPLTEDFGIYFKNPADWDEFKRLCDEIGILTMGDIKRFMEEEGATPDTILDVLRNYRKELGDDFEIRESLYNFTEEEMAEYNMDEDGVSLDSYDEYVRCNWCGEVFTAFECEFEADLGWLCDRCYSAIRSRGEKLTIITNPTEEDIAKTLTEEVEMTKQELKDKFGTDDVDLINAGREPEERVTLKESEEPVEMNYEDLPEETKKEIERMTKFINDAVANKQTVTAADIKKLRNKKN